MLQTFADVIDRFGGPAAFARETSLSAGAAKQAKRRNSLSAAHFGAVAEAARRKGIPGIDEAALAAMAANRRAA